MFLERMTKTNKQTHAGHIFNRWSQKETFHFLLSKAFLTHLPHPRRPAPSFTQCPWQTSAWNPGPLACPPASRLPVDWRSAAASSSQVSSLKPVSHHFLIHSSPWRLSCPSWITRVNAFMSVPPFFLFFFFLEGSSNHNTCNAIEEVSRGVAVEKLDSVKKWGINTYKVIAGYFAVWGACYH